MILQDTAATTASSGPGEDQQVLLERINCLILLMAVIFVLLCLVLSVCFILLVYFFLQKKKTCSNNCSCRSVTSETQISKNSKTQTFLSPPSNYVWTVEQDPIYEDILDLKNKSNATVTSGGGLNQETSSHEVRKKSSVQYGVITAKEVAKFVPCSDIVIRR